MKLRYARGQRGRTTGGFALVLSLLVVTVVAGLCAGFVQLASATARTQSATVDQLRAFYLAEAGLAEAFLAVRMGRTGGIGTELLPAKYGDGYVFVQSTRTLDARVWLRSIARVGRGRAVLGMIVKPEKPPLGFFAEDEVVIEAAVYADGFDSATRTYEEELQAVHSLGAVEPPVEEELTLLAPGPNGDHFRGQTEAIYFSQYYGTADLLSILANQVHQREVSSVRGAYTQWFVEDTPIYFEDRTNSSDYNRFLGAMVDMKHAYEAGALTLPADNPQGGAITSDDSGWLVNSSIQTDAGPPLLTERGGAIGSNGDVAFLAAEDTAVNGSVTPGVMGSVTGLPSGQVAGSTEARVLEAQLDPVRVPAIVGTTTLVHSGAVPHVIGEGESGFDSLQVTNGAELVVCGPATIRVHELRLEGGSILNLDTRDGNVELFVTGNLIMEPTSFVETTAVTSKEVSIVAGTLAGTPAPSLVLEAESQFHGTIYAPESTVRIGTNFEVFGSVAAARLEIAPGSRLHFDDKSYSGELPVPVQESWQILELPTATRKPVKPTPEMRAQETSLAMAHDLEDVDLSIRYTDVSGQAQTYSGPESGFDWREVESVEARERVIRITEAEAVEFADAAANANSASASADPVTPVSTAGGSGRFSAQEQEWREQLAAALGIEPNDTGTGPWWRL